MEELWSTVWKYVHDATGPAQTEIGQLCHQYDYGEIALATKYFDQANLLGRGTYGSVHRGTLRDGTEVAVKSVTIQEAGFEQEVRILSHFHHPNLVLLLGFAAHPETSERLLLYEFMSGGDTEQRLRDAFEGRQCFLWQHRLRVCIDAACGLSHLASSTPIAFHRDIKPANILLDKDGNGKLADFGLALFSQDQSHKVESIAGTVGYACPHYSRTGMVTENSEMYSFGMVLVELLVNAPPAITDAAGNFMFLVSELAPHEAGAVERMLQRADPSGGFPGAVAQAVAALALQCIDHDVKNRPRFVDVLHTLRSIYESFSFGGMAVASPPRRGSPGKAGVPPQLGAPVPPKQSQWSMQAPPPPPPGVDWSTPVRGRNPEWSGVEDTTAPTGGPRTDPRRERRGPVSTLSREMPDTEPVTERNVQECDAVDPLCSWGASPFAASRRGERPMCPFPAPHVLGYNEGPRRDPRIMGMC
mmetsp:Transcript_37967/g.80260  ORF Transcript_37967/g.80260 Transcript_37967/m.80260 type:complete len:473 (+) Transcript_37967:3-1421(+)